MHHRIPKPTIARLNNICHILESMEARGKEIVFSNELGDELGTGSTSIRKDISFLGEIGHTAAGYNVKKLKEHIFIHLGLDKPKKVCIVGLGRLGNALLNHERFNSKGFQIIAGFDSNINIIELMDTTIPLYPACEITRIVQSEKIDLGIITVPEKSAQSVANRLIAGGIKGIISFTPVQAQASGVFIQNLDVLGELRLLSAFLTLQEAEEKIVGAKYV